MRTTKTISISLPPAQLKEMEKLAKKQNRTMSELVREAFRRYQYQQQLEEANAYGQAKAQERGITEADVVRLTKQVRKELSAKKRVTQPAS
jgi:CopG family transcriptional regulator / antitoxin EndoAI